MAKTVQNTRKLILEAALRLFKERGFDKVSIAEISEAAGVSLSTFYYQFTNKGVLFNNLAHQDIALPPEVTLQMLTAGSPLEKLRLLHQSYAVLGERLGPDLYGHFIKNRITQRLSYEEDENYRYSISLMTALIKSAQDLGEIRNKTAPADLAETAVRLLVGVCHFWCVENGGFDLRQRIQKDTDSLYEVGREDL
jgi:AcrR family transcriptional regulator